GEKHPAWRFYCGPIPRSSKRLLGRLAGLPWAEYELQRKEAAAQLGLPATTVDWLTKHDNARTETPAAVKSRRHRLQKTGVRFPRRDSWHFGPIGTMLAIHSDGGPIYAQLTMSGSTFRWRLMARDRKEAAAIMEPAHSARALARKAVEKWGDC